MNLRLRPRTGSAGAWVLGPVLAVALLCQACPGTLDDPGRFADASAVPDAGGSCPDVPVAILGQICAVSGCHSSADMASGLNLESPDVGARLAGVCATNGSLLIDPAAPTHSVLYAKLTASPPFGARMPFGGTPLDAATLACVLSWVTEQKGDAGSCRDAAASTDAPPMREAGVDGQESK